VLDTFINLNHRLNNKSDMTEFRSFDMGRKIPNLLESVNLSFIEIL